MKQSAKTAFGGIAAALSLTILFLMSIFPSATIAAPAVASIVLLFIVLEIGRKWAVGVYFATGLLAVLLIPSKEAAILYVVFFGYYPIIKALLEQHIRLRALEWVTKLLLFNVVMTVSYYLMIRFLGIEFEEIGKYGRAAVPILLAVGSVAFVGYDFCLTLFVSEYLRRWQKRFRKLFRIQGGR